MEGTSSSVGAPTHDASDAEWSRTEMTAKGKGEDRSVDSDKRVEEECMFPTRLEEVVSLASSLIAAEIREGNWIMADENTPPVDRESHALAASESIEQFGRENIVACLLGAGVTCSSEEGAQRAFLAALLSLREILTLNAHSIFFQKCPSDSKPSQKEAHSSQVLATAVIVSALHRLPPTDANPLTRLFFRTIRSYDGAHPDFALPPLRRTDQAVTPLGRVLPPHENTAYILSYNRARDAHPLTVNSRPPPENALSELHRRINTVPTPNAAAVYMVEEVPVARIRADGDTRREDRRREEEERLIQSHLDRLRRLQDGVQPPDLNLLMDDAPSDHDSDLGCEEALRSDITHYRNCDTGALDHLNTASNDI